VPATINVEGALECLTDAQQTCVYRVVQEALTNCARHANAKTVHVSVSAEDDNIQLIIRDDGAGFVSDSVKGGLGLLSIRERVEGLNGSLVISSSPNKGTVLQVVIPTGVPV
jgi:signal transduction histidine kinase